MTCLSARRGSSPSSLLWATAAGPWDLFLPTVFSVCCMLVIIITSLTRALVFETELIGIKGVGKGEL